MVSQLSIAECGPEEFPDVIDAAEELKRAKADATRAQERVKTAEWSLMCRLKEHKAAVYDLTLDGNRYRLDLVRAEVRVKMTFVGKEE